MASAARFAQGLIGLAALGAGGAAPAQDPVAGALLGAGAGAILGHAVGGPDAAVAGGIFGAVTGAAIASSARPYPVDYRTYGPPPDYYPRPPRRPVYIVPPAVVFVPSLGYGYWRHGVDSWGHPFRTWIPAPPPHRHYAPPPRRYHPGYGDGHYHGRRW